MPVIIPPAFFQISVIHHGPSTSGSSPTWTFGCSGTPDPESLGPFFAFLDTDYPNRLSEAYAVTGVRIADSSGSVVEPVAIDGAFSGTVVPPQVACLVRKKTGLGGRERNGRFYWPGCLRDDELGDDGRMNTTAFSALEARGELLNTALSDGGLVPVILHSGSSDPTVVEAFEVQRLIATQRRRLRQ